MICETIRNCSVANSNSKITLNDRKGGRSTYRLENPTNKKCEVIDFEKDVFSNDVAKCDYGIRTESVIYYIELKGCEVQKGIKQLLETFTATEKCFDDLKPKARLIVTKFPKPGLVRNTAEYKNLVKKLKHVNGKDDNLIIQTSFTENI